MLSPPEYKRALVTTLNKHKRQGHRIVGYGASAKGNTLLNYCGIGPETIDYIVDSTPEKIGKYTPGTHIPVVSPIDYQDDLSTNVDIVVILSPNWSAEILAKIPPGPIVYAGLKRIR